MTAGSTATAGAPTPSATIAAVGIPGPVPVSATVPLAHRVSGTGPPLLLINGTGWPGDPWRYPELMAALEPRRTVITFDHRGTGATPGTDGEYSTRLFAADAARLIEDLRLGPVEAVGHSMGGRVLQWLLLDRPDLVTAAVLAASGPGQIDPQRPPTRGIPLKPALLIAERGFDAYIREQIRTTFFPPDYAVEHPETLEWLVTAFIANKGSLEDYLKHVIARQQHETTALLDRMTTRTLCLVGERDTHEGGTGSHLAQSQFLARRLPNAELIVVPRCAHGYFWQEPSLSGRILLDWLDGTAPRTA